MAVDRFRRVEAIAVVALASCSSPAEVHVDPPMPAPHRPAPDRPAPEEARPEEVTDGCPAPDSVVLAAWSPADPSWTLLLGGLDHLPAQLAPGPLSSSDRRRLSDAPHDRVARVEGDVWIFTGAGAPCRTSVDTFELRDGRPGDSVLEPPGPRYQVVARASGCTPADRADRRAWVVDSAAIGGCSFVQASVQRGQVLPRSTPRDWLEDDWNAATPRRALPTRYRALAPACRGSCLTLWQTFELDTVPPYAGVSINRIAARHLGSDPCFHERRVEGVFELGRDHPVAVVDEARLSGALVHDGRPRVLLFDRGGSYRAAAADAPDDHGAHQVVIDTYPGNQDGSCDLW